MVVSLAYKDLPEKGEAVKVDEYGNVIAWFMDGMLIDPTQAIVPDKEITK